VQQARDRLNRGPTARDSAPSFAARLRRFNHCTVQRGDSASTRAKSRVHGWAARTKTSSHVRTARERCGLYRRALTCPKNGHVPIQ